MASHSSPQSPSPVDHVSSSKCRRLASPSSSVPNPARRISTLGYEREIRRLREQLSESQAEVSHLKKEITRMREDAVGQDELKNVTQKILEDAKRRSDKALEEANQRINYLRTELEETRVSLQEAKDKLLSREERRQVLMDIPYSETDPFDSNIEAPPTLSETEDDDAGNRQIFKSEPDFIILEDTTLSQMETKAGSTESFGDMSTSVTDATPEDTGLQSDLDDPALFPYSPTLFKSNATAAPEDQDRVSTTQEHLVGAQMMNQFSENPEYPSSSSSAQSQTISGLQALVKTRMNLKQEHVEVHKDDDMFMTESSCDETHRARDEQASSRASEAGSNRSDDESSARRLSRRQHPSFTPQNKRESILIRVGAHYCVVSKRFATFNFPQFYRRLKDNNGRTVFSCNGCNPSHVTHAKQGMEDHIWSNHGGEKFYCYYCRKSYKSRMAFAHHIKTQHMHRSQCYNMEAEQVHGDIFTHRRKSIEIDQLLSRR